MNSMQKTMQNPSNVHQANFLMTLSFSLNLRIPYTCVLQKTKLKYSHNVQVLKNTSACIPQQTQAYYPSTDTFLCTNNIWWCHLINDRDIFY